MTGFSHKTKQGFIKRSLSMAQQAIKKKKKHSKDKKIFPGLP